MADNILLQDILGGGLPAGLLSPEQEAAAQQRAQNAALLNFAFGALQASRGQPGQRAPGLGQIIGQAGPVGVQAYQQSFDQTLANLLRGVQVSQLGSQIQRQQALQAAKSLPTTEEQIKALQRLGAYDEIANIGKATQELRRAGLMRPAGAEEAPSPFATYLQAQSPQVRELAKTYESGFRSGIIDEETAYKRIESLGKMEDAFISRDQSRLDRLSREASEERNRDFQRSLKETDLTEKLQSQIRGIDLSAKALTDLKEMVAQKGTAYFKRDQSYADLQTAYQKALFNLKDLYELGALQMGDVEQINRLLQDPTSLSGYYLGKEGVLKSIESVEGLVKDRAEALKRTTSERFKPMVKIPVFPTVQEIRSKFNLEGK